MKKLYFLLALSSIAITLLACVQPTITTTATPKPVVAPSETIATKPKGIVTETPKPIATPKLQLTGEAPYYQGKTIELVVPSSAGGGTDNLARTTAAFLPRYIPGNPRIIVRNQPGAAGAVANDIFYQRTKPDGLPLMQNSSSSISMQLRERDIVKYDLTKFKYIANVNRSGVILTIRKGLKERLTNPRAEPLVVGSREGEETWLAMTIWGKEFLGWNFRWILGFGGTGELELAFRRGELDVFTNASGLIVNRVLQEGLAEPLSTLGTRKGDKFMRRPDFPDVPTFEELLGDKKPTGLPWQAYMAWVGPELVDKFLVAPPGTPDRIVSTLVDAFTRMAQDPQFIALLKRTVAEEYDISIGKESEKLMNEILSAPPEASKYSRDLQIKNKIISK